MPSQGHVPGPAPLPERFEPLAAPLPAFAGADPLPPLSEREARSALRGERETGVPAHDATSFPSASKYMHWPTSM